MKAVITCLFILVIVTIGWSQLTNNNFEHLTTEDGLSSNKVEAILQDKEGFYWISTQNGLNRFDGTSFRVFRHSPTDSTSLTDNNCRNMLEDLNGDIWVATYKGVSRYKKSQGIFQPVYFHHPTQNFEISNRIAKMVMDTEGHIWLAGMGLWKYDILRDTIIHFTDHGRNSAITGDQMISHIVLDTINNGLWLTVGKNLIFFSISKQEFYHQANNPFQWKVFDGFSAEKITFDNTNRLCFFDPLKKHIYYFDPAENLVTPIQKEITKSIKEIQSDPDGRLWIFHWSAPAEIYDPFDQGSKSDFFIPMHRHSILSPIATYMFVDHDNNYWIASDKGVSIYNERNQYYRIHQFTGDVVEKGQAPTFISAIGQHSQDEIWIATNKDLYKYNLRANTSQLFDAGIALPNIFSLCRDENLLWVGSGDRLICIEISSHKVIRNIQLTSRIIFIELGNNNDVWAGLWTGGLYHFNKESEELTHYTRDTRGNSTIKANSLIAGFMDKENLWIGYNIGGGFSKYSMVSKTFTHLHPRQKDLSDSNDGTITVITSDSAANLWLGTHGSGIIRYNPVNETYDFFQQDLGLSSNYINSIIPDQTGNLWISTADGINHFDSEKERIDVLDIDLTFDDNDFVANGILGDNQKIYFFRYNEFVEIDPEAYRPHSLFPKMVVSRFTIFDEELPVAGVPGEINLTHRENFFSFEFSAIRTQPDKEIKYAYQLKGFDKNWKLAGPHPIASYTNVPGGHYVFQVKTTNEAGQWSGILLDIPLYIKPPFWFTWWFITLAVCLIAAIIYSIYWYRIRQLRRIYSIKSKISRDLHDEVGSTLSSINVYSSIASKSLGNNMEITKKALNHIYQNSRQVMDNMSDIVWAINSGHPGTSTLEDKLKNYGYELLTPLNINVTYKINNEAEKKLNHMEARKNILMIAKEAMNNIARYSKATEAVVGLEIKHSSFFLTVSDNGNGFTTATRRKGNGLINMQHRTESMGGKFTIDSDLDHGTTLTCTIPVTNISSA